MSRVTIQGYDEVLKSFELAPENVVKVTRKALREASAACRKTMKSRLPRTWAKMCRYSVKRARDKAHGATGYNAQIRLTGKGSEDPKFQWYKAYWNNYGTLEGRDASHNFSTPVRSAESVVSKRRRGQSGIKHKNFFESSIVGWETQFFGTFEQSILKQKEQLFSSR